MSQVDPEYWFLSSEQTSRLPHFTTGNAVTALIDGSHYMADLRETLLACDGTLLIAGWRVTGAQILNPTIAAGRLSGDSFFDLIKAAAKRGCSVKALLFNVPGTRMPGPFRLWHAKDNYDFARAIREFGGEALLDSRLARIPASAHHQKFIVATSKSGGSSVAYVGGIDVCLDRWDHAAHDGAPERQQDGVEVGAIETHTASQPAWHDVQVRVEGPAVVQIWQAFRDRWNDPRPANSDRALADFQTRADIEWIPPIEVARGTLAVQVNQTLPAGVFPDEGGPGESTVARAHALAIDRAEHFIYIEDQYIWPCELVEHLENALQRGVRVLMVVARDYDAPGLAMVAKRLRLQVVDRLRRAGGHLFRIFHIERNDGKQIYLHSKLIIVDDRYVSVGSANFNARSLTNDTELQLGIVDMEHVESIIGGKPQTVCRFAHDLRRTLWAEHIEVDATLLRDPVASIDAYWAHAPIAPSRRAHPHEISLGLMFVDPIAEFITTLITERMAEVPHLQLPAGIDDRSAVKLAVDVALRGPHGALLMKFLEELLNPDVAPTVSSFRRWLAQMPHQALDRLTDQLPPVVDQADTTGYQLLSRLRRGELAQMVDWFDPGLLVKIGIRDIISGTIGQYADQRLMQAASDPVASEAELVARYDYSDPTAKEQHKRVAVDHEAGVWVDYVADLGDGFEATYSVAHLLAHRHLRVRTTAKESTTIELPAGEILVMGGDQAYPQATTLEYEDRLVLPYNMAFTTSKPSRKLFAIPGNHDWYDGLNAFSSLFTSARDRISGGIGRQIGGWRCYQHRSYFAIKLPHDWWIWGPDIQLEGSLDDPQRDYFDIISDHTKPGDKIIICLAEPSWHHDNYDNLHEISMLARKNGAKLCAVLAGDWHHYSRYTNDDLGVQFVTSGGGGAFAHATHQLKDRLDLHWVEVTDRDHPTADPADPMDFNRMERRIVKETDKVDFTMKDYEISATRAERNAPGSGTILGKGRLHHAFRGSGKPEENRRLVTYPCHSPRIYPSKTTSRLLSLKNLLLPFRNKRFALFIGLIYFLYAWVFEVSAPAVDIKQHVGSLPEKMSGAQALANLKAIFFETISPTRVMQAARSSPFFFFMLLGLWAGLIYYVELGSGLARGFAKFLIGTTHFLCHLTTLLVVSLLAVFPSALFAALPTAIASLLGFTLSPGFAEPFNQAWSMLSYALVSILVGGFVGAFIMGLYWTITSLCLNMHCGDAFGALMIKDYKHFLRMRFLPDQVTIYPIAIDRVPGPRGWRVATASERNIVPSQIVPTKPLDPHLIEEPIVISVRDVRL
ncbi:MAG: phospholipase D family protein [Hyphomicrobiaceae bacterium]